MSVRKVVSLRDRRAPFWTWSCLPGLFLLHVWAQSTGLGGVESRYSTQIERLANEALKDPVTHGPLELRCWTTPGDDYYVGVEQRMEIGAGLRSVATIMDDMNHYKDLFPGFEDIHISGREGGSIFTFWEMRIPIPFVPNIKYEMIYKVGSPSDSQRLYLYQLRAPGKLTASDGFVVLSGDGANNTHYIEYDFVNAHWGAAKIFGARKLWKTSVEDIVLADVAIKLKAENPAWTYARVRRELKKRVDNEEIAECVKKRAPFM